MLENIYSNRRVLVTGHTGFKGSWLCEWLLGLGAEVYGYALDPVSDGLLFDQLELGARMANDVRGDLSEAERLRACIEDLKPDFVFHLAAQAIVRKSYREPVETFATNVMGAAHVLDAVRLAARRCVCIMVTTDKCYHNREWLHAYREVDPMGGHDPYSASKGAAELVIDSYRLSFPEVPMRIASARAGNVIGGGDWAEDRIVPDCVRALFAKEEVLVRNKTATRPWQHVLEPLGGYLTLAAQLDVATDSQLPELCGAFNFGPPLASNKTVADLVRSITTHIPGKWVDASDPNAVHEASKLNLSIDKAFHLLNWSPVWGFSETIEKTCSWYTTVASGAEAAEITQSQINEYVASSESLKNVS